MKPDQHEIDRILARGNLSGPAADEILGRVLDQTTRRPRRWLKWLAIPTTGLAAALGVWLVVVRSGSDSFNTKGGGQEGAGALDVVCDRPAPPPPGAKASARTCPVGGTLTFVVNAALVAGRLGAYAERVDAQGQDRIWYFPTKDGLSPAVSPGGGSMVVPDGIRLGPEHQPGRYKVTVWIADRPLARTEIDRAAPELFRARSVFDLDVQR